MLRAFVSSASLFRIAVIAVTAFGIAYGTGGASAQGDRSQSIRMLVGFAPGGGVDIMGRVLAQKLQQGLGVSVYVENVSGASGNIAAQTVSKSTPDGRTVLFVSSAHTMNAAIQPNLPFDAVNDFSPVSEFAESLNVIVVHPSLKVSTLGQLIDLAKEKPGTLNYGSGGLGTNSHMSTELLKYLANIDIMHIPYRGASPFLLAMLSGEVHIGVASLPTALPFINEGRLVALAVTTRHRSPTLPNVPTAEEAGVKGYEYSVWYGLLAPPKTPAPVVLKIRDQVAASLSDPDVLKRLAADGATPVGSTPQAFEAFLKNELEKWTQVAKRAKIRSE